MINVVPHHSNSSFRKFLQSPEVTLERQVEDAYNKILERAFGENMVTYPYKCDGYVEINDKTKLITEYKYDMDFSTKSDMSKVACQLLYYLKKFEENGRPLPNVCMIGDRNECFVFHSNTIAKYLDFENVDWNKAPSSAGAINPDLVVALIEDENFNPFVYKIDQYFDFNFVIEKIIETATDTVRQVRITEHNVDRVFDRFINICIKNPKKISANDQVGLFFGAITNPEEYYLHPTKKNILVTPNGNVQIDGSKYKAFIGHFSNIKSPKEKARLASISDRLIEDTNRRRKGEFYTPTPFVDYAHKMIAEQFGENWKDEYVVWDCCCGTKNLTRDYKFKELYCSTLENAELEISKQYNPEAIAFQFDFLNDELDKLPKGLLKAFEENRKIIFFLNPPYGTSSSMGKSGKNNINSSMINDLMAKNNIGECRKSLQSQFLYRIINFANKYNLTNINISIFCTPIYMSGPLYKPFRNEMFKKFNFSNGFLMNASHFEDVAGNWGISFSIWKSELNTNTNNFVHKIIDMDDNGEIIVKSNKIIYNIDHLNKTINEWVHSGIKYEYINCPKIAATPIEIRRDTPYNKGLAKGAIGSIVSVANNCYQNNFTTLFSGIPNTRNTIHIFSNKNFDKICTLFAARKLIVPNWINSKDEYCIPNENHENFIDFTINSIIYSIFSGQQSSLRDVEWDNKKWDIKNEFFWMSKNEIEELADQYNLDDVYSDAHTSDERFVYLKIKELIDKNELSPEAKAVYEKACEIARKSFKYRGIYNDDHPEVQILNWDAGWYQIKLLAKEYLKEDLDEFRKLYKNLSDKMRPMVYELGFLRK